MAFNARPNGNGKGNTNAKGNGNWNNNGNGNGSGNSNGNGNGNDVTFYLPILDNRNDRYCGRCAAPVKSFWPNCRATTSGAAIAKHNDVPDLPRGWKYCAQCKVIARKAGTNFCRFCGHPAQGGRHFLAKVKTMERMKLQLEEALSKQVMDGSDGDDDEDPMGTLNEADTKATDDLMAEVDKALQSQ